MTRLRIAAALATMLTAFLLQATLVGPLTVPVPISLPAVVVAAVALTDGPGTGLVLGFGAGLVADLASGHPAGVLALCWMGVGVVCGICSARGVSCRRDAAVAAVVAGAFGTLAAVVVAALDTHSVSGVGGSALDIVPALLADALLALAVVWPVRRMLHSESLRAPHPVLLLGTDR